MHTDARPERDATIEPAAGGDPRPPRSGGPPRPALIGLGVIAALAAILLAIFMLRPQPEATADASPGPTASLASDTPEQTDAATPSTTAEATASAAPSIPETWTEAAVFSEPGQRYVLGDLVAWSGGLVAVGTLYEDEARNVFGPPPPREGRVWRSTDGTDWVDATPTGTFVDIELAHLFEAADGALIVIGNVYPEVDAVSAAWETSDGETWTPIELAGISDGAFVLQVASGAQGHVASTYVVAEPHPLYSSDGRTWEPTLDDGRGMNTVAAGDEGFVAFTFSTEPTGTIEQVVASADGLEWFDAISPGWDGAFLTAPRGGDWIATTTRFATHGDAGAEVATWRSANGLDWSTLGEIELASLELGEVVCLEFPGALHGLSTMTLVGTVLSGPCGEGAVIAAGGSYASLDGVEWGRLPFGDQAFAAGAVMVGDRIVIGTDARTNTAPVVGVTFWISEAP